MASRNTSFHDQGVADILLAPLKWFCLSVMILLGLILAAWVVDWGFVFWVWPEGLAKLQGTLEAEFARTFQTDCWCGDLPRLAIEIANGLYALIFKATGIHTMGVRFAHAAALSIPDTLVREAYLSNVEAIQVAMVATQRLGVRTATLLMPVPLLALACGVAMSDGLVQRAIRRACGGHESSSIYHRAKYLQLACLVMAATIFLLWPLSIDLVAISGVASAIVAVAVRVQWSYYKKHL